MTEPVAATTTKAAAAAKASAKSKSSSKSGSKSKTESVASGDDWERTSYYNAADGVAENIVFLGNYGGEGSGVFDT